MWQKLAKRLRNQLRDYFIVLEHFRYLKITEAAILSWQIMSQHFRRLNEPGG